jgi:hypothetical protein
VKKAGSLILFTFIAASVFAQGQPVTATRTIKIENFNQGWQAVETWLSTEYMTLVKKDKKQGTMTTFFTSPIIVYNNKEWVFSINKVSFKITNKEINFTFDNIEFLEGREFIELLDTNTEAIAAFKVYLEQTVESIQTTMQKADRPKTSV